MKIIKKFDMFITEELNILKGPSDNETEEVFNSMTPTDALKWSVKGKLDNYIVRALERGADINCKNTLGETLLMLAAENGQLDKIKILIEYGADVNIVDNSNWSALMGAALHGYLEIVKYLVEHGADVNIENKDGRNALMLAAINDRLEIFKFFMKSGSNIKTKDSGGDTILDLARPKIKEYLISINKYKKQR
jgi:ankyrin repeat protein